MGGDFHMIQIIYGKKGSGKTKRIIDMANEAVKAHEGSIVFIDDDNRYSGILVPLPGIEPTPPALERQSLDHWTTREVPHLN